MTFEKTLIASIAFLLGILVASIAVGYRDFQRIKSMQEEIYSTMEHTQFPEPPQVNCAPMPQTGGRANSGAGEV